MSLQLTAVSWVRNAFNQDTLRWQLCILRHALRDTLLAIVRETSWPHKAFFHQAICEVDHSCCILVPLHYLSLSIFQMQELHIYLHLVSGTPFLHTVWCAEHAVWSHGLATLGSLWILRSWSRDSGPGNTWSVMPLFDTPPGLPGFVHNFRGCSAGMAIGDGSFSIQTGLSFYIVFLFPTIKGWTRQVEFSAGFCDTEMMCKLK